MNFWTAMAIIAIVGALVSLLRSRSNASAGITEDFLGNQTLARRDDPERAEEQRAREAATQAEIAELKERIAVLERIATDAHTTDARERARITAEIEALRGTDSSAADAPGGTNRSENSDAS